MGTRELLASGDLDKRISGAGMSQGLIYDIPSCQELMDRIIGDAEAIIRGQLSVISNQRPERGNLISDY